MNPTQMNPTNRFDPVIYVLQLEPKQPNQVDHYFLYLSIAMSQEDILAYSTFTYDYLRMYCPIAIVEEIPLSGSGPPDYIVFQYMAKYGIEAIRGGSYTDIYIKPHYTGIQYMIDSINSWIQPDDVLYDYFVERRREERAAEIEANEWRYDDPQLLVKDEDMYYRLTHDSSGTRIFWQDYLYDITPEWLQDPENADLIESIKKIYSSLSMFTSIVKEETMNETLCKTMLYTIINAVDQYEFHLSTHVITG